MGWLDKPLLYLGSRPIKINQGAKHVGQRSLSSKVIVRKHADSDRDMYTSDAVLYVDH